MHLLCRHHQGEKGEKAFARHAQHQRWFWDSPQNTMLVQNVVKTPIEQHM